MADPARPADKAPPADTALPTSMADSPDPTGSTDAADPRDPAGPVAGAWAGSVRRGARVLLVATLIAPLATGVVAFALRVILPGLASRGADLSGLATVVAALPWVGVVAGLATLIGVALLTAPPPRPARGLTRAARLAAKPLALLWWVTALADGAASLTGFALPPVLPAVGAVAFAAGAVALLVYVAELLARLGRLGPSIASLIMAWYAGVLLVLQGGVAWLRQQPGWEATTEVLTTAQWALSLVSLAGACVVLGWLSHALGARDRRPPVAPAPHRGEGAERAGDL
jgi:hypothetical protein